MNAQTVFLEGKHVGITGANGFLGTHICELLVKKKAIISAYVYSGTNTRIIEKAINETKGDIFFIDITKPDSLKGKFEGVEYLFQIAGTVAEWAHPVKKIFDINFRGAKNVHKSAKRAGVKRTVHTSTMAANGSCLDHFPSVTHENALWDMKRTGPYAVSKHLGDRIALAYNRPGVYETVRIRPHQILGWGDTGPSAPGQIVLRAMTKGFPMYIDQVTQIVHIQDVAEAHIAAMERGRPGEAYNIASAKPISAYEFLCCISKFAGVKPPKPIAIPKGLLLIASVFLEAIATHITHKTPPLTIGNARIMYKNMGTSIEKARRELGFSPRPWQEAVEEAVRWFRERYRPEKRMYDI